MTVVTVTVVRAVVHIQILYAFHDDYLCLFTYSMIMFPIHRIQKVEAARADAERIRLIGEAEATSIEAVGKAEAERMRLKASAYKQYGDAAMVSLILETLPKVSIRSAKAYWWFGLHPEIGLCGIVRRFWELDRNPKRNGDLGFCMPFY